MISTQEFTCNFELIDFTYEKGLRGLWEFLCVFPKKKTNTATKLGVHKLFAFFGGSENIISLLVRCIGYSFKMSKKTSKIEHPYLSCISMWFSWFSPLLNFRVQHRYSLSIKLWTDLLNLHIYGKETFSIKAYWCKTPQETLQIFNSDWSFPLSPV